jgi:two-component system sensor histidine kinase PilS (NtrC family)
MNLSAAVDPWQEQREEHWRSLFYFCLYRIASSAVLIGLGAWASWQKVIPVDRQGPYFSLASVYLALALGFALVAREQRILFHVQLSAQVMVDACLICILGYIMGGVASGMPLLVLVSLAGAAIIARGRLVLFYAAVAAMILLFVHTLSVLHGEAVGADFFQVGIICSSYFATAVATHRLARSARFSEALARQQAIDLANLAEVNQAVLKDLQDAVLVVDRATRIRQSNPRALELFGPLPPDPEGPFLSRYSVDLADRLAAWSAGAGGDAIATVRAPANSRELRPRFASIGGESRQAVSIFLEDVTEAQEQARQGKLAALGRLTANIAHEIRNPLAAISHAAELLGEDYPRDPVEQKLIRIISDNTVRLNRLVNEVLELNRRDRARPEVIDADSWFAEWRDTFCASERVPADWIRLELARGLRFRFDRNHFDQVVWNLVRNALRFCKHGPASVRVCLERAPGARSLQFDVLDDGPGVPAEQVNQLFEPFFTTDSQGTGLGLYIARELCVANGATLEYIEFAPGAQFRLLLQEA